MTRSRLRGSPGEPDGRADRGHAPTRPGAPDPWSGAVVPARLRWRRPGTAGRGSARVRLGCRQAVLATLLDQLLGDGEAHERAPDVVLRVPVGEGRKDRAPGARHAVTEQRQDVG